MSHKVYSAYYRNLHDAGAVVSALKDAGIDHDNISIVSREDGKFHEIDGDGDKVKDALTDVAGKAALGGGVGALLGVAALAIPGVGPFVAAGAIAQAAIGGAAAAGAATGAVIGGLAGAFENHGISKEDAEYYTNQLETGGVVVAVQVDEDDIYDYKNLFYSRRGYSAGHPYVG
ncbi:hypothetical protein N9W89_12825 [Hellea sp.]|nr:hypothetical protein [Hellea sp.]